MSTESAEEKLGKYELGRTIGEGTFATVKSAKNTETGEIVAIKVLAKNTILEHKMVEQVLSSQTNIYFVSEFASGGMLFDKIVQHGRLNEDEARRYFQQLIDAIAHCHSKGVCHRNLKPENLLLDSMGNLKVSDFGLGALSHHGVKLLHTTRGTQNFVAPEVLGDHSYDGAAADVWSCGVILFFLMAGCLPFEGVDLPALDQKINAANYVCPSWFTPGAISLIQKTLDPNPENRIKIEGIREDPWFQKNYMPIQGKKEEGETLGDVYAGFYNVKDEVVTEQCEKTINGPYMMNAFEMITLSQGLNLSPLFDKREDFVKRQTRFVSREPAKDIISTIEAGAKSMGLEVYTRNYKTRIEGVSSNNGGNFAVALEVFQVAPSLCLVDVRKADGDRREYHKFYKSFCKRIDRVIWKSKEDVASAAAP